MSSRPRLHRAARAVAARADDSDDSAESQKPKRVAAERKVEQKRVRGVRGKLRMLTEMPFDVLFEIFYHLNPIDVLHLSRTTKSFRAILMRRSSISIWKSVCLNIPGLPECPSDMNEPEYINLVFSKHCHFCLATNIQEPFWAMRIRCCRKCIELFFDGYDLIARHFPVGFWHIADSVLHSIPDKRKRWHPDLWLITDVEDFASSLRELEHDRKARDALIDEAQNRVKKGERDARKYEEFVNRLNNDRSRELEGARKRRKKAIVAKLTELGWGHELDELKKYGPSMFSRHAIVNQPRDLTERIWANNRNKLIEFMETCKADRLAKERRALINSRINMVSRHVGKYTAAHPTEIIPGFADICFHMQGVRDLILSPPDVDVNESSFAECMLELPAACREWRHAKDAALLDLVAIPKGIITSSSSEISPLQLAITYFRCCICDTIMHHPRALAHSCMVRPLESDPTPDDEDLRALTKNLCARPWNYSGDRIVFDADCCSAAFSVIQATGMVEMTTTVAQMDDLDWRYECLVCLDQGVRLPAMDWRMAVRHGAADLKHRPTMGFRFCRPVDRAVEFQIKELESNQKTPMYRCAHCNADFPEGWLTLHLSSRHVPYYGLKDGDFFPSLDYDIEPLSG